MFVNVCVEKWGGRQNLIRSKTNSKYGLGERAGEIACVQPKKDAEAKKKEREKEKQNSANGKEDKKKGGGGI